jgi:tetratricopeptide (TPR) repeat protein
MYAILLSALLSSAAWPAVRQDTVPLYDNLGTHQYRISTQVPAAQSYFDQGLRLYYGFNHAEAIRSFREAQRRDSTCAMCFWGEALAWGPNINAPMDSASGAAAWAAITGASARLARASESEAALVAALRQRYAEVPPPERSALDSAYAHAMMSVTRRFPGDQDIAVLSAEAAMDLRPWNYWTPAGTLQPGMAEALAQLEQVIANNASHPGACHFYIHAVEAMHPERAVACAERLAALMPGAGHLVHMPGHIYIRVGRYLDAIQANEHAVHADQSYIRDQRPDLGTYTAGYYPHNYDFLAFAAAMAGRRSQALAAADSLAVVIPHALLGAPGMGFLQHHLTRALQMRVRFAEWDAILEAPAPADSLVHARGIWHYARGRAFTATGRLDQADRELRALGALAADPRVIGLRLEFNESPVVLKLAEHVLRGVMASARGAHADAETALRQAAEQEAALTYGEPPEWSIPVRQSLGHARLSAGDARGAERAFRDDLARFPANGWSLAGLIAALEVDGRGHEAGEFRQQLAIAQRDSDVSFSAER